MKNITFVFILLCFVQLILLSSATNTNECPQTMKTCQCLDGNDGIDVDSTDTDHRVVGLAAATGALGGILATGTAFAAYFHFRGGGGIPGGGLGGGELASGGNGKAWPPDPILQVAVASLTGAKVL